MLEKELSENMKVDCNDCKYFILKFGIIFLMGYLILSCRTSKSILKGKIIKNNDNAFVKFYLPPFSKGDSKYEWNFWRDGIPLEEMYHGKSVTNKYKKTYNIKVHIKNKSLDYWFPIPRYLYSNPPASYWAKNYPPSIQFPEGFIYRQTFLFRGNCEYKIPVNSGENDYWFDIGAFYKNRDNYQIRIQKTIDLPKNHSIRLIINPDYLEDTQIKIEPSSIPDGPCEFRDRYFLKQKKKAKKIQNADEEDGK